MLTKAILTGAVLAGLSGGLVYFGTEGAAAIESEAREDVVAMDTELAGAVDTIVEAETVANNETVVAKAPKQTSKQTIETLAGIDKAEEKLADAVDADAVDADAVDSDAVGSGGSPAKIDPPKGDEDAKPKTKWLDQYLKSTKPRAGEATKPATPEAHHDESHTVEAVIETETDETVIETETNVDTMMSSDVSETGPATTDLPKRKVKRRIVVKMEDGDKAGWAAELEQILMDEDIDPELVKDIIRDHQGTEKNVSVVRRGEKSHLNDRSAEKKMSRPEVDYDLVLQEARKLQVVDMRNQAILEIMDYAVDQGDIGAAADLVDEFANPELRDTARAKIGVGLANRGDAEAAFAVLDEIEIDELTAPIRLEIIAALMATQSERAAAMSRR